MDETEEDMNPMGGNSDKTMERMLGGMGKMLMSQLENNDLFKLIKEMFPEQHAQIAEAMQSIRSGQVGFEDDGQAYGSQVTPPTVGGPSQDRGASVTPT